MRTIAELLDRIQSYRDVRYLHKPHVGYVVWRVGTGDNLEIVFIGTEEPGHGYGKRMLREMVAAVTSVGPKPYHSAYAYRLRSNEAAGRFYRGLGFREVNLGASVYRDDETVLAWIPWTELVVNVRSKYAEADPRVLPGVPDGSPSPGLAGGAAGDGAGRGGSRVPAHGGPPL